MAESADSYRMQESVPSSRATTTVILGVGEYQAAAEPDHVLKILGLGSCVALIMVDQRHHCIAVAHVALPDSTIGTAEERRSPARYADTAVDAMIRAMKAAGGDSNPRRYTVKLVGGANFSGPTDFFTIGKRNVLALKRALWERGMGALSEDVGGHSSRCVAVDTNTCRVVVYSPGREEYEI